MVQEQGQGQQYTLHSAESAVSHPRGLSSTHPINSSDGKIIGRRALITIQRLHSAQLPRVLVNAELRGDNTADARTNGVGKGAKSAAVCICGSHLDEGRHYISRASITEKTTSTRWCLSPPSSPRSSAALCSMATTTAQSSKLAIVKQTDSYHLSPAILVPDKPPLPLQPSLQGDRASQGLTGCRQCPGQCCRQLQGTPGSAYAGPVPLRGHREGGAQHCRLARAAP